MNESFRSELIRLRRRGLLPGCAAAVVAFSVIVSSFSIDLAVQRAATPTDGTLTIEQITAPDGLATLLGRMVMLLGLIAGSLGAAAIATEHTAGTIRTALIRQPHRSRFLVGKILAVAATTTAFCVLATIAVTVAAHAVANANDLPTNAWTSTAGTRATAAGAVNLTVGTGAWVLAGAALGTMLRSSILAIAVGGAYGLFEGVAAESFGGAARWLPGQVFAAVSLGGRDNVTYLQGLAGTALITAAVLTVTLMMFNRRDVTD